MNSNTSASTNGPSRRKVVAGAAWAVPAVVVATAAPSMASSQGLVTLDPGQSCKGPGANNVWAYWITVCVTNPSATESLSGTIVFTAPANVSPIPPLAVNLVPSDTDCFSFFTYSTNSSNFDAVATLTYTLGDSDPIISPSTLTIGNFNPCCSGPGVVCPPGCKVNECPPGSGSVPEAPTNVVATPGDGQAVVTWDASIADPGYPVLNYTVSYAGGEPITVGGSTTTATVTGLTNGETYTFSVVATNAIGNSLPGTADPITLPLAAAAAEESTETTTESTESATDSTEAPKAAATDSNDSTKGTDSTEAATTPEPAATGDATETTPAG